MDEHPDEILGITGGRDEIGVRSVTVPYLVKTLEECDTVAAGRIVMGLPERSRTFQAGEGGLFTVMVLHQGQPNPSLTPTQVVTETKPSYKEEPIEAHPRINEIVEEFSGHWRNDGTVYFDPTYTPKGESNSSALSKGGTKPIKNPFCGCTKFWRLEVTFTRTYAASGIPGNFLSRIGKVVSAPPGAPPSSGKVRYLVMPGSTRSRGNITEITEEYLRLDENTPKQLYEDVSKKES